MGKNEARGQAAPTLASGLALSFLFPGMIVSQKMQLSASQGIGYLDHSVPFRFEWVLAYQAQRHPLVSNQETFSCE